MALAGRILFVLLSWLQLTIGFVLEAPNLGLPAEVRVWSALKYLLDDEDNEILADLYPVVTQIDGYEMDEYLESHGTLEEIVSEILSTKYDRNDIGILLPHFCNMNPMGFSFKGFSKGHLFENTGQTFFELNGKQYHNSDDMFYLKSSELKQQSEVKDLQIIDVGEILIGKNPKAPIIVFYGCSGGDSLFDDFNRNLYSDAVETGKFRYVWRSTCALQDSHIKDIPIGLTVDKQSNFTDLPFDELEIPEKFQRSIYESYDPTSAELQDLDLKVAAMITNFYNVTADFEKTLSFARGIINNFPIVVTQLISAITETSDIVKGIREYKKTGIDYQMLGLYVNGQNWKLSSLDQRSFLIGLQSEYKYIRSIQRVLQTLDENSNALQARTLLANFSQVSLSSLKDSQPIKVDLHRIPGFSESIIYFNDIETDVQYNELTKEIKKFFEKSKFGEIPEYRCNWNEVIFVIDLDSLSSIESQIALDGLLRAIKVVAQGYPQRIGFIPLSSRGLSDEIIRKIYQLKEEDILQLEEFLETLLDGSPNVNNDYDQVPNVAEILKDLQIFNTTIIINGEIYPFRKNTWHYLIASVIKKDTAYIKRELLKYSDQNSDGLDVRQILHLKSGNMRHSKYTPNYFSDATYTLMNDSALDFLHDRVLEYVKGANYNILHTITLVDDFGTSYAISRLRNMLNTGYAGVRIRLLHIGSLTEPTWISLREIQSTETLFNEINNLVTSCQDKSPTNDLDFAHFEKWLMNFPKDYSLSKSFMVLNGRLIHFEIGEIPTSIQFEGILKREAKRTLDTLFSLESIFPGSTAHIDSNLIEMLSAALAKPFYHGAQIFENGLEYTAEASFPRLDLSIVDGISSNLSFQSKSGQEPVELLLVIDPLEERSQKLLHLVDLADKLSYVNCKIIILPTEVLPILPISRIYLDNFEAEISESLISTYQIDFDTPSNLYISNQNVIEGIIIEIHAFDSDQLVSTANIEGIGGLCLELVNQEGIVQDSCITMQAFGYGQFILSDINSNLEIRSCDPNFKVVSVSTNARSEYLSQKYFQITNLDPMKVFVQIEETKSLVNKPVTDESIHIFTVLQDQIEEEKYKSMVLSIISSKVQKESKIDFWLLDQSFFTEAFRSFCRLIDENPDFNVSVNLIKYTWPLWLRPQRFVVKRLEAFKILFVDVIFPVNIKQVIYMDPTSKPMDFTKIYDYEISTPLAMKLKTGSGYWNEGYWADKLSKNNQRFFSTNQIFLINLEEFRRLQYGDKLRLHYQRLSADPHSLVKIDQDLVNDLQVEVPISKLRLSQMEYLHVDQQELDSLFKYVDDATIARESENEDKFDSIEDDNLIWHDEL